MSDLCSSFSDAFLLFLLCIFAAVFSVFLDANSMCLFFLMYVPFQLLHGMVYAPWWFQLVFWSYQCPLDVFVRPHQSLTKPACNNYQVVEDC